MRSKRKLDFRAVCGVKGNWTSGLHKKKDHVRFCDCGDKSYMLSSKMQDEMKWEGISWSSGDFLTMFLVLLFGVKINDEDLFWKETLLVFSVIFSLHISNISFWFCCLWIRLLLSSFPMPLCWIVACTGFVLLSYFLYCVLCV